MIEKFIDKGYRGLLKLIKSSIEYPFMRLGYQRQLKRKHYTVDFINEGSISVRLPKVSTLKMIMGVGIYTSRNINYMQRPFAEVLLRKTIYELYKSEYLMSNQSIIDIGCWIGDNSLVWAKYLSGSAKVIAIDPSHNNLMYARHVASINQINNVKFVQAVCADKIGIKLEYDGLIDHTSFKITYKDKYILSTTLDKIMEHDTSSVGLLHVDVEGFELSVLKGAKSIITRDLPVITFEQHISKESVNDIVCFLKGFNYCIFMINEVLAGCDLDCRNFIAFPPGKGYPLLTTFKQEYGREMGIFSAVIGDSLIEI